MLILRLSASQERHDRSGVSDQLERRLKPTRSTRLGIHLSSKVETQYALAMRKVLRYCP